MSLPHGFKAKANRIALALRHQLGLTPEAPIDLSVLAKRLNFALVPLCAFTTELADQVAQLLRRDPWAFSALLLPVGGEKRVILFNDRHSLARRNSSIAHEISHFLLAHPPTLPFDNTGSRSFDEDLEDEANCVAAHLLIPNEAACHIVNLGISPSKACEIYGVSLDMLEYRLNTSGARIRYQRRLHRTAVL